MSSQLQPKSKFRLDIQGLRALAVIAIVIFHISPGLMPGGYIGVDVFFVISGYLIIGHIWRDLNANKFSLLNFYSRRIKRLFPALIVMLMASSVAAYYLFIPEETSAYAKSLIATLLYVSNFFFYTQTDYFNPDLEMSPLLHTWSLAVEEQFYFIFPIILMLIFIKQPKRFLSILCTIALISFIASQAMIATDASFSFYASPTRFFQFIIGGIVFYIEKNNTLNKSLNETISAFCLLVIVACLFLYDSTTPFPGIYALIPTVAVALLIYTGSQQGIMSQLLSNKPAVFLGKISYSTYLWHWPIIAFYKASWAPSLSRTDQIILFIVSILLGYVSWRFIENTTRSLHFNGSVMKPIMISVTSSLAITVLAVLSFSGLPGRFSQDQLDYSRYAAFRSTVNGAGTCFLTDKFNDFALYQADKCITYDQQAKNTLLVGDSHAAHLIYAFDTSKAQNETISQANAVGCKPTLASTGWDWCTELMQWTFEELVPNTRFDTIILSAQWSINDLPKLKETITELENHTDKIIVFGRIIEYEQGLAKLLTRDYAEGKEGTLIQEARNYHEMKVINDAFRETLASTSAQFVSTLEYMCTDEITCQVVTADNIPMQYDYGHLTPDGALTLLGQIKAAQHL